MHSFSSTAIRHTSSSSQAVHEPGNILGKAKETIKHQGRDGVAIAVHALHVAFGSDHYAFREAILALTEQAPQLSPDNGIRQELIEQAGRVRSIFDVNERNAEGKAILDVAVQQNDVEFASYLLNKRRANPAHIHAASSPAMEALLGSWRLYTHYKQDKQDWSDLDLALQGGDHDQARRLLRRKKRGIYLKGAWEKALAAGQHDVLRAFLILSKPEELRELTRIKINVGRWQKDLRQDPGLIAALKQFPYQSAKRGEPENFNCSATFHSTTQKIACRHLALYQQKEQRGSEKIKFDYAKFGSLEAISANVKEDIEQINEGTLRDRASEVHLISNKKFGQFLSRQFQELEKEGKLLATKLTLVTSTNHMMNLGLMIKEKDGKKSYVVKFFDPNETTTGTRSKSNSVKAFEMQTLESYITAPSLMKDYYPEPVGMSMIYANVEGGEKENTAAPIGSSGRTALTSMDIDKIDATVMWYLMRDGFTGNLNDLADHFETVSDDKRLELLAGKNNNGVPALYIAMGWGRAEVIEPYGALMEKVPKDQRFELLAAKCNKGFPALYVAMVKGRAEVIKPYGELVRKLTPEDQHIELLAGKAGDGEPALLAAMYSGHAEVVKSYVEVVKSLFPDNPEKQADLLFAKTNGGLFMDEGKWKVLMNSRFWAAGKLLQLLASLQGENLEEPQGKNLEELRNALFDLIGRSQEEIIEALQELECLGIDVRQIRDEKGESVLHSVGQELAAQDPQKSEWSRESASVLISSLVNFGVDGNAPDFQH